MGTLLPNAVQTFTGPNGTPLSGGSVYFYIPGTTTPKNTWQDPAQTILNTDPVILNANGQAIIWGSGSYRQVVYDANNNLIWDQVTEDTSGGLLGNMTDNRFVAGTDFTPGTTTQLTLSAGPGSQANLWVYFDGAFQADDQYALSGTTLTFNSPIPVGVQEVNCKIGSTVAVGTPGSGTITDSSVAANANIDSSKLSFLQSGSGAVRRTVQSKERDIANLYDFGAKGDGVTDDSPALIAAIAAHSDLTVSAGTFLLNQSVTIPNGTIVRMLEGAVLSVNSTFTLTINGLFEAPINKQVFSGSGSVVGMRLAYPEWWGAVGDGVTDDWAALNSQHACVQGSLPSDGERPTLRFAHPKYAISKTLTWAPTANINLAIEGGGIIFTGTSFVVPSTFSSTGPAILVDGNTDGTQCIADWIMRGIRVQPATVGSIGSCTGGIQIGSTDPTKKLIGLNRNLMEDVHTENLPTGITFCHVTLVNVRRWSVWNDGLGGANNCMSITQKGGTTSDITFYDGQTVNAHGVSGAYGVNITSNNTSYTGGGNTVAGIKFINSDFYNADRAISMYAGGGSLLSDIWIQEGCEFDGGAINTIYMESNNSGSLLQDIHVIDSAVFGGSTAQINIASTGTFGNVMDVFIHDNWLDGSTSWAIAASGNGGNKIQGINVHDNTIRENNFQAGPAIEFNGIARFACNNNVSTRLSGTFFEYLVQIDSTCDNFVVTGNIGAGIASGSTINNLAGTGATKVVTNNV